MKDKRTLVAVLVAVAVVIAFVGLMRYQTDAASRAATAPRETGEPSDRSGRTASVTLVDSGDSSGRFAPHVNERDMLSTVAAENLESTAIIATDPENQPRAWLVADFRGLKELPPGFQLDGVVLTPEGFQLAPPEPGKEYEPRTGFVEAPAQMLNFHSNAVALLWTEQVPDEKCDVFGEVAVSPDGKHWGPWQLVEIDDGSYGNISEFFPDGTPNPSYGYTPGTVLVWGLNQYSHMRYRFRLYSEGPNSPTVSRVRVYYQDSTLGQGRLADPNAPTPTPAPDATPPPSSSGGTP